jgi:transposase, IS5 family
MARNGFTSHVHRKKPAVHAHADPPRQWPQARRAFAHRACLRRAEGQNEPIARARIKIGLANLIYNIKRCIWLERTAAAT